ncbi:MAG TPA: TetR family transcriptional regulator [Casimicrobiaceae bacterium]|nr:TetR family transcriptional regulator [Casimicrobiaceae bacterium]
MAIRQRAVHSEDKQERHHAILDAAERLLGRAPERVANVAEVADEAGLAKGTVYLYFPSKDELLLAVHERRVDEFFRALNRLLALPTPVSLAAIMALTREHMIDRPTFLPLATRCFGVVQTEVPRESALAFKGRMMERLGSAGAGLERHFPELPPGGGIALLRHSYALIVGLWQMSSNPEDLGAVGDVCSVDRNDYPRELDRALRALWEGTIGRRLALPDAANSETV